MIKPDAAAIEAAAAAAPSAAAAAHMAPRSSRRRGGGACAAACCVLPLWLLMALGVGALLLLVSLAVFGVMYSQAAVQRTSYNGLLTTATLSGVREATSRLVTSLREAAALVPLSEPLAANCSMPRANYEPAALNKLFYTLSAASPGRNLNSVGIIAAERTYNASYPTGKISWQVANFYVCPAAIYAWCDPSTYPVFLGHCVSPTTYATNWSDSAYSGFDYGLNAVEQQLLFSLPSGSTRFNAISTVYPGSPYTLTLLTSFSCGGSTQPYALSFAEQSLAQLTAALQALVVNATTDSGGGVGTAFIVERSTGYLVAASVAGQVAGPTVIINGENKSTRVLATAAPDGTISGAAVLLGSWQSLPAAPATTSLENDNLWAAASVYQTANLDWALVVVIPKTAALLAVLRATAISIGLSLAIIFVGAALLVGMIYCCVSVPMARLRDLLASGDHDSLLKAGGGGGGSEGGGGGEAGLELGVAPAAPPVSPPAGGEPISNVREINDLAISLASYSSRLRAANSGGAAVVAR